MRHHPGKYHQVTKVTCQFNKFEKMELQPFKFPSAVNTETCTEAVGTSQSKECFTVQEWNSVSPLPSMQQPTRMNKLLKCTS